MSIVNNPSRWQVHYDYARSGLGGFGLGMIVPHYQNWRTSTLPFSISLANRVNTGVSFDTPSGGIAERQRWASRGFQGVFAGHGPRVQYPGGSGMDGMGCHCGCGGACGHSHGMGGLTFDGTGLLGTGLFSGDWTTWGIPEAVTGLIGAYAFYAMFMQAGQTKTRLEGAAQRRRRSRAARDRAKAKALEEKGFGGIFA